MSLRTRLVLGVLVLAVIGLVTADVATYLSLRSFLFDRTDRSLETTHRVVETTLLRRGPSSPDDYRTLFAAAPGVFFQVRRPGGDVIFTALTPSISGNDSAPLPVVPAKITVPAATPVTESGGAGGGPPEQGAGRYLTVAAVSGGGHYRLRASLDPGPNVVLIVGVSLHDVESTLDRLLLIELLVTGAVLAAIVGLGLWIVRIGLRPLDAIGATAGAIAAGDLTQRVDRAEERTEIGRLGLALNGMLGQIESAFNAREASERRLRRFVADASHELRTPLAGVRAYAELFRRGARERPDDLERAMGGIERESERMGLLVDDLLLLARLDEGRPLDRKPVELGEIAVESVETARAVEPERSISIETEPAVVIGDRDRLRQVIDNLLSNVRAHTPPGTAAHVTVSHADGEAVLEVRDEGPGMTDEASDRVFERFYRSDASRSRQSGGVGLGLSIVAAVVEAHDGAVSLKAPEGEGAAFRITMPLADLSESLAEPVEPEVGDRKDEPGA
jgi:two-component system, OmpR family, sensor kinase